MATKAVFSYNNLDDTIDLNAHFAALAKIGVLTGGLVTPVAGTLNVSIAPFFAMSNDGMIVSSDTPVSVSCVNGQYNYIVLRAVYNAPAAPTLSYECQSTANYNADPQKNWLIVFATIDLTSSPSTVSTSNISYVYRDIVDQIGHGRLLGSYSNTAARDAAWPSTQPTLQQIGDFVMVTNASSGQPGFFWWDGAEWNIFSNYETLNAAFAAHISGVVDTGTNAHVTANIRAALAGTSGTPSGTNLFVTANDTTRMLTTNERAAALTANVATLGGGNPSSTNPFVVNGIQVAITQELPITGNGTNKIAVSRTVFNNAVYVGKLGINNLVTPNVSSALQYFKVEDNFYNGYVDANGPLYIVDILDSTGAASFNPNTDPNVSTTGYWDPVDHTAYIYIEFNRVFTTGYPAFIKFNGRGSISQLAPNPVAYLPPSTGFREATESFQTIYSQVILGATTDNQIYLAPGSSTTPSLAFTTDHGTGLFYAGTVTSGLSYSTYNALGIASNTETVALFSRDVSSASGITPLEAPLVFEQTYDGTNVGYRLYQYVADLGVGSPTLKFGVANYSVGFVDVLDVSGTQITAQKNIVANAQIITSNGTAVSPALAFGGAHSSGFYYLGTETETTEVLYNAVGLGLGGNPAFAFASNLASESLVTDLYGSLVFLQNVNTGTGAIQYQYSINQGTSGAPSISNISHAFGDSSYSTEFNPWFTITSTGVQVGNGQQIAAGAFQLGTLASPATTFGPATSGWSIVQGSTSSLAYNSSTSKLTTPATVVAAGLAVNSGTEFLPSITFAADGTSGFYYAGVVGGGTTVTNAVGVTVGGESCVLFARSGSAPGGLSPNDTPLVIEQTYDGTNTSYNIIGFNSASSSPGTSTIAFGFGDYTNPQQTTFSISKTGVAPYPFHVYQNATFDALLTVTGTGAFGALSSTGGITVGTSSTAASFVASSGSTASSPSFLVGTNTGLYGSSLTVGLAQSGSDVLHYTASGSVLTVSAANTSFPSGTSTTFQAGSTLNVAGTFSLTGNLTAASATLNGGSVGSTDLTTTYNAIIGGKLVVNGYSGTGQAFQVASGEALFGAVEGVTPFVGIYGSTTGNIGATGDIVSNSNATPYSLTNTAIATAANTTAIANLCTSYVSTSQPGILYDDAIGVHYAVTGSATSMIRIATLGAKCFFVQVQLTFTGSASGSGGGDPWSWAIEVPTTGVSGTLWNALNTLGSAVPFTAVNPYATGTSATTMTVSANAGLSGFAFSNLKFVAVPSFSVAFGTVNFPTCNMSASGWIILP